MAKDHVETIVSQWRKERPDLDPSPIAIVGRLSRLSRLAERAIEANFKKYKLQGGTYDLLATLRRKGEPFTLTPTQLQTEMMLSSGATTYRIDQLEKRGLLKRSPDPEDRRGTLVRLTAEGKKLTDKVTESHLETERAFLSSLSDKQKRDLAELLGKLAERVET